MKEITFEELIEGKAYIENKIFEDDEDVKVVDFADVLKLLQQVREATIAEVLKLADDNFFSKEPKGKLMENIEEIKTDRIKTDEKA